jgi:transcriptional regulator with XRE-family HTH domain
MPQTNDISVLTPDHLGTRLRARRESFGLSVSDLADTTHIGEGFLTAIETLDEAALPAIGYTLGFVRTYAKALGMDGDLAVKAYKADTAMTRLPLRDAPHVILRRQIRLPRGFVSALTVASVFVMIGAWYGTQSEAIATPIPMVDISAQYTAAEPAAPDMQEGLFTLRATAPSWIEIRDVLGTVTVNRIFLRGETWQGETAAGYSVSVRDAGAVELYDGPKLIGPLGSKGAPIANLTLSRDLSNEELPEIKSAEFQ